jgi:hypothetical protein
MSLQDHAGSRALDWMRWKAELADGTATGLPLADARLVDLWLAASEAGAPNLTAANGRPLDVRSIARVALLRDVCALSFRSIATNTSSSTTQAQRNYELHRKLLANPAYAKWIGTVPGQNVP